MFDRTLEWLGLRKLLPEGPVMTPWARSLGWFDEAPAPVVYAESAVSVGCPILPVMAFGVAYDLDLVIVSRNPTWNMHEYAMIRTPRGAVWLAKDAREATLEQTIVADLPEIDGWLPEIPVERKSWPVEVTDRSTPERLDLDLRYENFDSEMVEVHYEGPLPRAAERKRNGSTMGHSRSQLMAVLDLSHKAFASRASISYGGKPARIDRILGLVPFNMVLHQVQGGLVIGRFTQTPTEAGFTTTHHRAGAPSIPRPWTTTRLDGALEATQRDPLRTLTYRFIEPSPDTFELSTLSVSQWGRGAHTFHMALSPALPDLRRRFEGRVTSRWVIDINGQQSHATGTLSAWWTPEGPRVALTPEAPWWTTDRPMETTISLEGAAAEVSISRV